MQMTENNLNCEARLIVSSNSEGNLYILFVGFQNILLTKIFDPNMKINYLKIL